MTDRHYRRSARQSGIHANPRSTVTLLVTFVSVQTPSEFGQRVEVPGARAHFETRVCLHKFVDRKNSAASWLSHGQRGCQRALVFLGLVVGIPNLVAQYRWNMAPTQEYVVMTSGYKYAA
jgi:hypothetical protein